MGLFNKKNENKNINFTDSQQALQYLLHESLHGMFAVEDLVKDNHIYLPEWQLTITPAIQQLTEQSAVLDFYLQHPEWSMTLYECCASPGNDTKTAIGLACASFLFGMMKGITDMFTNANPRSMETEFAGSKHLFDVYLSDVVGMGEAPQVNDFDIYWKLLKEDIKKRMGNQPFCYVKVYTSMVNGKLICECRIDDIVSSELSQKLTAETAKWQHCSYASHKQFFFIKQDTENLQPYPYRGERGEKEFIGKVLKAIQLFHTSTTQEAFDSLHERMITELSDATLATECRYFLPEICAENAAADKIQASESIILITADGKKHTIYKHQLADYYQLERTIFTAFQQGLFGEEANAIYQDLIGTSAICNVINQMLEQGSTLEDCKLTSLMFNVDERFEIR